MDTETSIAEGLQHPHVYRTSAIQGPLYLIAIFMSGAGAYMLHMIIAEGGNLTAPPVLFLLAMGLLAVLSGVYIVAFGMLVRMTLNATRLRISGLWPFPSREIQLADIEGRRWVQATSNGRDASHYLIVARDGRSIGMDNIGQTFDLDVFFNKWLESLPELDAGATKGP